MKEKRRPKHEYLWTQSSIFDKNAEKEKWLIEKHHLFKKVLENRSVSITLTKNQFQMDERPHSMWNLEWRTTPPGQYCNYSAKLRLSLC